jgi:threonylcarbamoyladenosine tRNA methylthiotransferase MtaB
MSDLRLRTLTLGCKVNQYETEYLRQGLLQAGWRDAERGESADLCVVNTCTVTAESDAKSRQAIRRMARENPNARVLVMGCYATRAPEQIVGLPGVAEVVQDKRQLPDLLDRFGLAEIPTGISSFGDRHRAYVKVQDGCLLHCAYCIIPRVRPPMSSRPVDSILDEVRRLLDNGYREIVLTGIHLGHYGVDFHRRTKRSPGTRLSDLVGRIVRLEGNFRVRLSSLEATEVTRKLIAVMAENPERVCPHLHICLQSGSESVLRRMNRRGGAKRLIDCCQRVQEILDRPALTTDVMVGFPGETDHDFEQTCRAVTAAGFSKVHIFPFSAREGTAAAEMADQVPRHVKRQRGQQLAEVAKRQRAHYLRSLEGRRLRVLAETNVGDGDGRLLGTACRYVPVQLPGGRDGVGQFHDVTARSVDGAFSPMQA